MSEPPRITFPRVLIGFAAGAVIVLGYFTLLLWPDWTFALVAAGGFGLALVLLLGLPAFVFLRRRQMLSIYAATLLGGILCALPAIAVGLINFIDDGAKITRVYPESIAFVLIFFFLPGCIGGLIGWLAAAGFRLRAS